LNIEDIRRQTDYAQINLQKLTDRQYEVIETVYRMGYFGYPRNANAKEVAASLGITSSTLTEHLNIAQAKIFEEIFQEE
jgi:predicted DNA binding protein